MWEVPLMACLSETYFQVDATDWDYIGQEGNLFIELKENQVIHARSRISEGKDTSRGWLCVQRVWNASETIV